MQISKRLGLIISILLLAGFGCSGLSTETQDQQTAPVVKDLKLKDGTYSLSPESSTVAWSAYRVRYGHEGTLGIKDGSVTVVDGQITDAEVILDMTAIQNTDMLQYPARVAKLEADLKSENFFDVEKYPTAAFTLSEATRRNKKGSFDFSGILLMKDIEGVVDFSGDVMNEGDGLRLTGSFAIDRTTWDIRFGSGKFFEDLGDLVISDEITINLDILATP